MKVGYALASLVVPGLGQALDGRRVAAAVWAILGALAFAPILMSVWLAPMFLVRLVALPLSYTITIRERQELQCGWDSLRVVAVIRAGRPCAMPLRISLGLRAAGMVPVRL